MICASIIIINLTAGAFTQIDLRHLRFAQKRCPIIKPASPCLKKFIKVENLVYRAVCGPEQDQAGTHTQTPQSTKE